MDSPGIRCEQAMDRRRGACADEGQEGFLPKLAANLTLMFPDLPFLERIDAAADAGFRAVEWMFSYDTPAEVVRARLDARGLQSVLINAPPGDWAAGERGLAGLPGRVEEARASVATAIDYARAIGCPRIHVMAGLRDEAVERSVQVDAMVALLREMAGPAMAHDITLTIEPLNRSVDMPGYLLAGSDEGMEIVERADRGNVKLQYDVYHMQIVEGDLARTIERLLPRIGHMQIADNPGRHEPGTGEIAYDWLLRRIDEIGYDGWIGCEYRPIGDTVAGLGWASDFLKGTR
jgi:hydroxypyruvate isomerase